MSAALDTFGGKTVTAAQLARRLVGKLTLDSPDEDWIMAESQMREVKAFAAEMSKAFSEAFAERLRKGGNIPIGERFFYAGKVKKTVRKLGPVEIFQAALAELAGDVDQLEQVLAAGWAKPATLREIAPKTHAAAFEVQDTDPETGEPRWEPRLSR